ncbi:hypothetical protein ACFV23_20355 [Streptomyces sp. NPDC059627]
MRARTRAAQARAEKTLRTEIAAKHPQLHDKESGPARGTAAARGQGGEQSAAYTGPPQGRSFGRSR